jgi:hypothetical protein
MVITITITIAMVATIGQASIGISTGDGMTTAAMTTAATGIGTTGTGINTIDTIGAKTFATTTLIDGRGVATGRATMTGVADDSMTMSISGMGIASDTYGTAVSGCHLPITRLRMSFVTTPFTNCGSRRMDAGGSELTETWYSPQSRPASYWMLSTTCSEE